MMRIQPSLVIETVCRLFPEVLCYYKEDPEMADLLQKYYEPLRQKPNREHLYVRVDEPYSIGMVKAILHLVQDFDASFIPSSEDRVLLRLCAEVMASSVDRASRMSRNEPFHPSLSDLPGFDPDRNVLAHVVDVMRRATDRASVDEHELEAKLKFIRAVVKQLSTTNHRTGVRSVRDGPEGGWSCGLASDRHRVPDTKLSLLRAGVGARSGSQAAIAKPSARRAIRSARRPRSVLKVAAMRRLRDW